MPLTDQVRVDREEIYDLLDQMRATIPEEIKQARWIVKERRRMLAEAKREAERVVKEAREQSERLISNEEVYKQAERAAEEIIEDARETERQIRLGAEDYADEFLSTLEVNLEEVPLRRAAGRDRLAGRDDEPSRWLAHRFLPVYREVHVSERWFSDEELADMAAADDWSAPVEAIDRGDLEEAKQLCGSMRYESQFMHDLLVDGVAGLILVREGEARRRGGGGGLGYSLERSWRKPVETIDKLDRRTVAESLAATWRATRRAESAPNPVPS